MTETSVYEALARHLGQLHPELHGLWHFDLSGVNNPSKVTRSLYSRLNRKGHPDFVLYYPALMPDSINAYTGLALEIKRPRERLKKRDGNWASEHIERQYNYLVDLAGHGWIAQFAVGPHECIELLDSYLNVRHQKSSEF